MKPDSTTNRTSLVVGGGWAGLAAAVALCAAGKRVILVESARQLGGRARCVRFGNYRVDNGQHLMLGAYRSMLQLLDMIGVEEAEVLERRPLDLPIIDRRGHQVRLRVGEWPAPLHLALAVARAEGLSVLERGRALRFGRRLQNGHILLEQDISAQAMLIAERQSPRLIRMFWDPLCLAALNTPVQTASARLFLRVLSETFRGAREQSDLLIPRTDLGTALPQPAMDFIERNGGKVILSQRVRSLTVGGPHHFIAHLPDQQIEAHDLILAVNPVMCRRLLSPHPELRDTVDALADLRSDPICTLYLEYPPEVRMEPDMIGLLGTCSQWVFDRRICGQPGLMAVVISGSGEHMSWSNAKLFQVVRDELAERFPHWPEPGRHLLIREKRATFTAAVNVDQMRPGNATPLAGLWLAGDFTATGLPATLEGAIRSGLACANGISDARE